MIETADKNNPLGEIKVSAEVLEVIIGLATLEVKGVYGMQRNLSSDIRTMFGRSELSKGVSLETNEFGAAVNVFCYFKYGVNVPKVAQNIQENIKEQVFHMTDVELDEVNVHIVGIVPEQMTEIDVLTASDLDLGEENQ